MENFFKNFKYKILSFLEKDRQKKIQTTFNGKNSKLIVGVGANVTINAQAKKNVEEVRSNIEKLINQFNGDMNKLCDYVMNAGTEVYISPYAKKLLALVKEEEGIIFEQAGLKALYLSLITGKGFKLHTEPMFIISENKINSYYFLHDFYRWYSMKSGLPGFDIKSQKKFKKYLIFNSAQETKKLKMEDIMDIEEAISRDQEATSFVLEYTKQKEGSKNVINKIKNDGSANI